METFKYSNYRNSRKFEKHLKSLTDFNKYKAFYTEKPFNFSSIRNRNSMAERKFDKFCIIFINFSFWVIFWFLIHDYVVGTKLFNYNNIQCQYDILYLIFFLSIDLSATIILFIDYKRSKLENF